MQHIDISWCIGKFKEMNAYIANYCEVEAFVYRKPGNVKFSGFVRTKDCQILNSNFSNTEEATAWCELNISILFSEGFKNLSILSYPSGGYTWRPINNSWSASFEQGYVKITCIDEETYEVYIDTTLEKEFTVSTLEQAAKTCIGYLEQYYQYVLDKKAGNIEDEPMRQVDVRTPDGGWKSYSI